jgi:hypothetical protein
MAPHCKITLNNKSETTSKETVMSSLTCLFEEVEEIQGKAASGYCVKQDVNVIETSKHESGITYYI